MTLAHNPRIVTDGLVFAYDMGNAKKSWKGAPTTNLVSGGTFGASNYNGGVWSYDGLQLTGQYKGWHKYTTTTTSTVNNLFGSIGFGITAIDGTQYTSSIEYINPEGNLGLYITGSQGKGPVIQIEDTNRYSRTWTKTNGDGGMTFYMYAPDVGASTNVSGTMYIRNPQVEVSSFVTPYVDGTRSNTQALLDWTGNNTITSNSLTYNSDNTFSFNGTSDYMTMSQPNINLSPNSWSIDGWINPNNQTSRFVTPQSNGIDNFLQYDNTNQRLTLTVCESADTNGRSFASAANTIPVNQWSHFSVSIDGFDVKVYANGVEYVNQTETIPMSDWGGTWYIGQRGNGSFYLDGSLSNLRIYNRALTASEVAQNFNALRGRYGI